MTASVHGKQNRNHLFCIYIRSTLSKGSEESKKVQVEEVQEVSSKTDMCE